MVTILILTTQTLAAYAAGRPALRWLVKETPDYSPVQRLVLELFLGAGMISTALFPFIFLGFFTKSFILLLTGLLALTSAALVIRARPTIPEWTRTDWLCLALLAAATGWLIYLTWTPVLYVDTWMYHLLLPRQWWIRGHMMAVPYNIHASFNLLTEIWNFIGLAMDPDQILAPKLWQTAVAVGAALFLAEEMRLRGHRVVGWIMAIAWLTSPVVIHFATSAYIDLTNGSLLLFAGVALIRAVDNDNDRRLLVLSSIFFGLAGATKVSGLVVAGYMGVLWLALTAYWRYREGRFQAGGLAIDCLLLSGPAFMLVLPWWLRNWVQTGNPLYPFFLELFPTHPDFLSNAMDFHEGHEEFLSPSGLDGFLPHLQLFVTNAWRLDVNALIMAMMMAMLARLGFARGLSRSEILLRLAMVPSVVYVLMVIPNYRFVMGSVLLILLVFCQDVAALLEKSGSRQMLVLCGIAAAFWLGARGWRVAEEDPYSLQGNRAFPGQRPAHQWEWPDIIHKHVPEDALLLTTKNHYTMIRVNRSLFSNPNINGPNIFDQMMKDWDGNPPVAKKLRSWGITHVLTAEEFDDPALARFQEQHLEPLANRGRWTLYRFRWDN